MQLATRYGAHAGSISSIRRPRAAFGPARTRVVARAAGQDDAADAAPAAPAPATRRAALAAGGAALLAAPLIAAVGSAGLAAAAEPLSALEPMDALKDKDYGKTRMSYGDFTKTDSGLQFLDLREGAGEAPRPGQTVVVDWSGYTIGYYGRPFEARNKPKGSSFTGENKDFYRFELGSGKVIPGFEEAIAGMKVGGIRRIVVPVELGYPNGDFKKVGPRPSTFAGERALDFVMSNRGMIDKTLLFDIELLRLQ
ncbi:MAG: putative FKBP-type peptidyl-prolyl cis-trans isomerase 7, chloroplastic [Monoraphidium minutum]|nr:MAG: putative FKBP-type peptidyl-prolyl cis-trans isomerase 7, chloroplastic [Monoraphidium minutum]